MSEMSDKYQKIIDAIGLPALLEQTAEECAELAHAALKWARAERGENPTPVLPYEACANFLEELADLRVCTRAFERYYGEDGVWVTRDMEVEKVDRWLSRIREAKKEEEKNGN